MPADYDPSERNQTLDDLRRHEFAQREAIYSGLRSVQTDRAIRRREELENPNSIRAQALQGLIRQEWDDNEE